MDPRKETRHTVNDRWGDKPLRKRPTSSRRIHGRLATVRLQRIEFKFGRRYGDRVVESVPPLDKRRCVGAGARTTAHGASDQSRELQTPGRTGKGGGSGKDLGRHENRFSPANISSPPLPQILPSTRIAGPAQTWSSTLHATSYLQRDQLSLCITCSACALGAAVLPRRSRRSGPPPERTGA